MLLLCTLSLSAFAQNLFEHRKFNFKQPDSSVFTAYVTGDNYYNTVTTADGYTLIKDSFTGFWCYAKLSADGESLVSTGIVEGKIDKLASDFPKGVDISAKAKERIIAAKISARDTTTTPATIAVAPLRSLSANSTQSQDESNTAYFPDATGTKNVLVLLAYFPYEEGVYDPSDYPYLELDETYDSEFDPRTAPGVAEFFNNPNYSSSESNYWGFKGSVNEYFTSVSLSKLAINATVSPSYIKADHPIGYYENFSSDPTNDGLPFYDATDSHAGAKVLLQELITKSGANLNNYDSVVCYYAGSSTSFSDIVSDWWTGTEFSGSIVKNCMILEMDWYYYPGIVEKWLGRTTLGWNLPYYNAGEIGLMGTGYTPHPVKPAAPYRVLSGWVEPTIITDTGSVQTFTDAAVDKIYKYSNPSDPNQYFLFENRYGPNASDWDAGFAGLNIWKIDQKYYGGFSALARLVPASYGSYYYYFYKAPNRTQLTPTTMPDSRWINYNHSDIEVTDISEAGANMSFKFNVGGAPDADPNTIFILDHAAANPPAQGDLRGPYNSIKDAIEDSHSGDTILLAKGHTYIGNITLANSDVTIRSFDPSLPEDQRYTDPTLYPEDTIIKAFYPESVIAMVNNSSTIKGVTITGGYARDNIDPQFEYGGGIKIGTPFEIDYVADGGSPKITDCIVRDNYAFKSGGGIYSSNAKLRVENTQIYNNLAGTGSGGGIFASFRKHNDPSDIRGDSVVIKNSIIDNNDAYWGGGIATDYNNRAEIINCTITNNSATSDGGGIDCHDGTAFVVNTIIWGNESIQDPSTSQVSLRRNDLLPEIYFHYSDIQGLSGLETKYPEIFVDGRSNIDSNPLFANSANRDYHLMSKEGRWIGGSENIAKFDIFSDPNNIINNLDMSVFASSWNLKSGDTGFVAIADFNLDGEISVEDFVLIVDNYLVSFDGTDFVQDTLTSSCINAGDIDPIYSYAPEQMENGYRINMGAYGGTVEASKSAGHSASYTLLADINGDNLVDADDYDAFVSFYTAFSGKYDSSKDYNHDGTIDDLDREEFKKYDFDNNDWLDNQDQIYFMNSWNWLPPWN